MEDTSFYCIVVVVIEEWEFSKRQRMQTRTANSWRSVPSIGESGANGRRAGGCPKTVHVLFSQQSASHAKKRAIHPHLLLTGFPCFTQATYNSSKYIANNQAQPQAHSEAIEVCNLHKVYTVLLPIPPP